MRTWFLCVCICLCPTFLFAQTTIQGTVIDSLTGKGISLINVVEKGTPYGTLSDSEGKFSIVLIGPSVLHISALGYQTKEILITSDILDKKESLTIKLLEINAFMPKNPDGICGGKWPQYPILALTGKDLPFDMNIIPFDICPEKLVFPEISSVYKNNVNDLFIKPNEHQLKYLLDGR